MQEGKSGRILLRPQQDYPAATVDQFCTAVLIYTWRHELKKKGLLSALPEALFLPVELDGPTELAMSPGGIRAEVPRVIQIELQLANGRCLRFDQGVDSARLTQLVRAVEAA